MRRRHLHSQQVQRRDHALIQPARQGPSRRGEPVAPHFSSAFRLALMLDDTAQIDELSESDVAASGSDPAVASA